MTTSQPPLEPRKYPWHRGDVVTLGFEKMGFVLDSTPNYLEVLWIPGTAERLPEVDTNNLLRLAHAASFTPKGDMTNLDRLEKILALRALGTAVQDRIASFKNQAEEKSATLLIRRYFTRDGCDWDKAHREKLFELAITPASVGILFRLQERIHRLFCNRH